MGSLRDWNWEILKWSFDKCWPDFKADLANIQETRDREKTEVLRLLAKDLVNYPRAPAVSDSFISHSFIQKIADVLNERKLILDLVGKANRIRKEAGNGEVPVIRSGSLVTNDTAYAAWRSVFREAGLNSPRMLAATLMVLPIGASPLELEPELEEERKSLLSKLKTKKSSTPEATK